MVEILTEEQIRKLVREEIEKYLGEGIKRGIHYGSSEFDEL